MFFRPKRFRMFAVALGWTMALAPGAAAQGHWLGPDDQAPAQSAVESIGPRSASEPIVRMAYVIPSNRTAQPFAVVNFRHAMAQTHDWFRDQMAAHGQGARSFRMETEADGETPKIHVTNVVETDSYLRGDIFDRTIAAATAAGLPIWAVGEVWVLIPEAHVQEPNGNILGGEAWGSGFGSGSDPGVALVDGDILARFKYFTDDRSYAGLTLPEIGPYPLVQNVSFFGFEGTTLSSVSSSATGAVMHELGHAFGLPHDLHNDGNYRGNLMGNGFRGVRGNFFPARYPDDLAWLSTSAARVLGVNRYFGGTAGEDIRPTVNIQTSGNKAIENGLLKIDFTTSDASGLVAAFLEWNGDRVGEMELSGTAFSGSFMTPYYVPGVVGNFLVSVYDIHGNRQSTQSTITATGAGNRAPRATFRLVRNIGFVGESVTLEAAISNDPDASGALSYEWDFDGDGSFDTAPSAANFAILGLSQPGHRKIHVRVTDPGSARSTSPPLFVECHRPTLRLELDPPGMATVAWPSRLGIVYQPERSGNLSFWDSFFTDAIHGSGGDTGFSDSIGGTQIRFYRTEMSRRMLP